MDYYYPRFDDEQLSEERLDQIYHSLSRRITAESMIAYQATASEEESMDEGAAVALMTVPSTIDLVTLPLILVILYSIMIGITLLAVFGISQFGSMASERFGNLPWYWGCCGIYVRNYAFLIRIASYVGLLMIGIQAALIFLTPDCKNVKHTAIVDGVGSIITGAMYRQSIVVLMVDLGFWGVTHILLPILKTYIDQEAFLYEPVDSNTNFVYNILCNVLGP